MIEWKCPHCGGIEVADSDNFDWSFRNDREMKELWECYSCCGYYFVYYKIDKIVAMKEEGKV
jgi:hypothetical protein